MHVACLSWLMFDEIMGGRSGAKPPSYAEGFGRGRSVLEYLHIYPVSEFARLPGFEICPVRILFPALAFAQLCAVLIISRLAVVSWL